ncbi:hypothetical protein ACP4OV_030031 [Aristida adscensionis]
MPPVRSSARGGRRGRGRGRGAAAAAAGKRRKRADELEVIEVDDDDKSVPGTKSRTEKTPSTGSTAADGSEEVYCDVTEEDGGEPTPARNLNLRRLRKQTMVSNAALVEENFDDVAVQVKESDSQVTCRSLDEVNDISVGVGSKVGALKETRQSSSRDGIGGLHLPRRSKRLRGKMPRNRDLDGGDADDVRFENDGTSSEDGNTGRAKKNKHVPRRSKRLRETYKSKYGNADVSDDRDTSQSSSDDDQESLVQRRRTKHFGYKLGTCTVPNDEDDSDTVYYNRKLIPHRRMSKRLQEKRKLDHVSDDSCIEASLPMQSASSSSENELLCNSVKASTRVPGGPVCLICKSGTAGSHIVRCENTHCSVRFHAFCVDPQLQDGMGTSECPFCKLRKVSLPRSSKEHSVKKIEKFVGHRMVVIQELGPQYQFLVKWHSLSHHHDCWVPLEWLQVFDRIRVHSYLKKTVLLKEVYSEDQRKPEWFEVDRAIACRRKFGPDVTCHILTTFQDNEDFGEYEFLVKWKGLDYCDATWEPCCTEAVHTAVSMLVERHKNKLKIIDSISSSCLDGVIPKEIHNGALYDYQLQGLQWIFDNFRTRRNVILADEMGLGKTVQVVCFVNHIIKGNFTTFPALILAPKSILLQWEKEFGCWGSNLNVVVYQGDKASRKCIQAHEMYSSEGKILFDALVTSYEYIQIDKSVLQKFEWSTIVIDEAHRLKKLDCNLATCLKRYSSEFRLLLTGTPLQNNMLELFSLLHYIDPYEFSDTKADGLFAPIGSGKQLTMEEKIARIHDILKPRMLRRMKSNVLKDSMPTKKWVEVPCALTDSQRELYIDILEKNYSKLNGAIMNGKKLALNNILMQLRKCCNHPYLFQGLEAKLQAGGISLVGASGKLQLLQKLLPRLKERGNRVLIFSQMTTMLDILEDFFFTWSTNMHGSIDGQTSLSERQESIKEYNRAESETFIFLMSTRAGGLGVDLPGADRVIIYDPDFNPFMDLQAQSRAHRIGQTRPVVVYQLITKCSVEEKILQKSKQKLAIENMLMNSSKKPNAEELQSMLLHGAKTIIDRKKVSATWVNYDDEDIENLLKLDPSSGEKCSSDDNGYLGSIVSFAHGVEDAEPHSPNVEDLKALKPATPKVDLGRGKRQRRVVNYADAVENSDSDDMYAPDSSSSSSSSSDDDGGDDLESVVHAAAIPATMIPATEDCIIPALEAPKVTPLEDCIIPALVDCVIPAIEAPKIPGLKAPGGSSSDDQGSDNEILALEAPKGFSSSSNSSDDDEAHG